MGKLIIQTLIQPVDYTTVSAAHNVLLRGPENKLCENAFV